MARRDARTHVELVDDTSDGPVPEPPPAAGAADGPARAPSRTRRRALVVAGVLVVVLAVVAVVGEVRQAASARERAAVLAALPTAVDPLDGPPEVLWTSDRTEIAAASARTPAGLLVVPHLRGGAVVVDALDPATGDVAWQRELLPAPATPGPDHLAYHGGTCLSHGADGGLLACMASDARAYFDEQGESVYTAPTRTVLALLDPEDGEVVADLSGAVAGTGKAPMTPFLLGDLVVVSSVVEDATQVVAVAPDGTVAWRTDVVVPEPLPGSGSLRRAWVGALGDHVLVATDDELRVLDATGATVRTVPLADDETFDGVVGATAFVRTGLDEGQVMQIGPDVVAVGEGTKVVRADHVVDVTGGSMLLDVDDGSDPRLLLTRDTEGLHGWDVDGAPRWGTDERTSRWALVVDGRVHATTTNAVVTLDARTGEELWRHEGLLLEQTPLTDGRVLLVREREAGATVADLVALDLADGEVLWRAPLPAGVEVLRVVHGVLVGVSFGFEGRDEGVVVLG